FVPTRRTQRARELVEAVRLLLQKSAVEDSARSSLLFLKNLSHDSFQERHVAVDSNLQEEVGELCAARDEVERVLRVLEASESGFGQRVDVDDFTAVPLRRLQRGEHARVACARILSDDEDGFG